MAVFKKTFFSLLISAVLCAGIAVMSYHTGVFSFDESSLYNPQTADRYAEAKADAETLNGLLSGLRGRFLSTLKEPSIEHIFSENRDDADNYSLSRVFALLMESVSGLQSVRIVDADGIRIHFSTYPADLAAPNSGGNTYRHYDDTAFLFGDASSARREQFRLVPNSEGGRMIFFFPLYDSVEVFRGAAVFTVSANVLTEALAEAGSKAAGETLALIAVPQAVIIGLPGSVSGGVPPNSSAVTLSLVTAPMDYGLFYGRAAASGVFSLPPRLKALVLTAIFLALFFIIFSLFNTARAAAPVAPTAASITAGEDLPEIPPAEELPEEFSVEPADQAEVFTGPAEQLEVPVEPAEAPAEPAVDWVPVEFEQFGAPPDTIPFQDEFIGGEASVPPPAAQKGGLVRSRGLLATALPLAEPAAAPPAQTAPPTAADDGITAATGFTAEEAVLSTNDLSTGNLPQEDMPQGDIPNVDFSNMDMSRGDIDETSPLMEAALPESVAPPGTAAFPETEPEPPAPTSPVKAAGILAAGEAVLSGGVIIEQGGIPYINKQRANIKTSGEKLDGDFKKLVESLTPPVP